MRRWYLEKNTLLPPKVIDDRDYQEDQTPLNAEPDYPVPVSLYFVLLIMLSKKKNDNYKWQRHNK